MRKPVLYVLCGIPASGKTTWATNFIKGHRDEQEIHYVSRDSIRFKLVDSQEEYFSHEDEVFRLFSSIIAEGLRANFDVIADATHLSKKSRAKLIRAIDIIFSDYNIIYVYFDISLDVCLKRNILRQGREQVPEEAICSMYNNMQVPQKEEDSRCIGVWEIKI